MTIKNISVRHIVNLLLPLLLISTVYEYASSAPQQKDAAALVLPVEDCLSGWKQSGASKEVKSWPKYVYNAKYGWFDSTHFGTGNPRQVIADVQTAVLQGGGVITITQDLRDGLTGYTAAYRVSGNVRPTQIIGVAWGIYKDWSWRFEDWQGSLPRNLVNPFTPFAIEDLPSQYIGFFAAARDLTYKQVFACYLGGAKTAHEAPPHLIIDEDSDQGGLLPDVERLENESFEPLVETPAGWRHRPWTAAMRLTAVPTGPETWFFLHEETWYFEE
ncbi:MAG: hypothetical protein H6661_06210 [Ardenticatenaceae bacterium]|nr:hypothetical protein [Ardenticatenaceae bacterium]